SQFKVEKPKPIEELIRKDLRLTVDNPEDLVVCRKLYSEFKHYSPRISVLELVKYLDKNPSLKELVYPLTESGYKTMYL
ncbi:MAG: acylneuraminate cytidylyltransferase, partial [Flavobacteriaceae bacterium]|nr:acylneuraminate cytidylyltransferase [Flavobacteriaceae bacterium]